MWILTFFPDLFVHLVFLAGLLLFLGATFLGMIPVINTYKTPAQIVGVIILAFGIYLEGGLAHKKELAVKVAELETNLAKAEAKSQETNTKIVEKIVKDTRVIRQKGDDIIRYVDKEIVKYDNQCVIPEDVIKVYNEAATLGTATNLKEDKKAEPTDEKKEHKMLLPPRVSQ
jgi:hypothetical protein